MDKRRMGPAGLEVSAIGMGVLPFTAYYGDVTTEAEAITTIRLAIELGVTLFDTADIYGRGSNELLLGRAVVGMRDRVTIATKFGYRLDDPDEWGTPVGRPEYVREACEESLKRLGVDVIDLYIQHRVDPQTAIEETVGAMQALVQEGKVRFLGLSEALPEDIRRAVATAPISVVQTEYSLFERFIENEILPVCSALDVGLVAYAPLGRGLLAGSFTSPSSSAESDRRLTLFPRLQGKNLDENLRLVDRVKEFAAVRGMTPAQLSLAWLLAQQEWVVPIPGTDSEVYLRENVAAADFALSKEDLDFLDELIPPGASAAGERIVPGSAPKVVSAPPDGRRR
jgi:aryl-alcohol dehydrogenase-like predicted oxidoreductase